jgi:3-oxoacyl-[acyl-carrier protein] reductase
MKLRHVQSVAALFRPPCSPISLTGELASRKSRASSAVGRVQADTQAPQILAAVLGAILTVQEAIKRFGADGGSIINFSSIVGSHPVAGALLYASTKGAIEALTKGLALELAPRKIRVNAIAPGHTETEGNVAAGTFEGGAGTVLAEKTPLGRLGRVTDIAPLAVFLASDESAWITGEVIRAAGGLVVAT